MGLLVTLIAVVLGLAGLACAVAGLVFLANSAWLWGALFLALGASLFVFAFYAFRAWRWASHSTGNEGRSA
jgi:hypothetical protein